MLDPPTPSSDLGGKNRTRPRARRLAWSAVRIARRYSISHQRSELHVLAIVRLSHVSFFSEASADANGGCGSVVGNPLQGTAPEERYLP